MAGMAETTRVGMGMMTNGDREMVEMVEMVAVHALAGSSRTNSVDRLAGSSGRIAGEVALRLRILRHSHVWAAWITVGCAPI
jgi:hypothetical protein